MKRVILSPVVFLAVVAGLFTGNRVTAQDLNSAIQLTRSEQYEKAAEQFKQLIAKEPGNSKNFFFYGENILQDYFSDTISNSLAVFTKEAKAQYEKGIAANATDPLNYIGLAKVAFFSNDDKSANEQRAKAKSFLQPYKSVKKMVPPAKEYAYILAKLAESYITVTFKVDTGLALPLIREAIRIDNKNKDIFLIAGDIFNLKNDGSNSIKNYNLAQEYDPTSSTANMKIGSIYVKARNLEAAIPYFQDAIKLNVNYAPAYRELGALYAMARKYDLSKENFKKYLDLTQGNIPAQIKYVISLFYSGEYDEVIKNVDEIFQKDKSKAYLNRLAGYSCYEKKDADYNKALGYMETLFKTVNPDLINKKDYLYYAKILLKKNQNYPKLLAEQTRQESTLEREKTRFANATAVDKPKLKPLVDTLTNRKAKIDAQISRADVEVNKAFEAYTKALSYDSPDKPDLVLLNEIANNYYSYGRYEMAAKTLSKLITLGRNETKDLMQLARWYYTGEKFKSVDSVCNEILKKDPAFLDAYLFIARSSSRLEPDPKQGMAKVKFETLIEKAAVDSVKNNKELMESFTYLGYHYMMNDNVAKANEYYNRMISLDPNNKEYKIRGLNGIAQLQTRAATNEKTIDGRLPWLAKAQETYNKVLVIDPNNESAKASLKWVQDFERQVRAGINPNELKGTVKDAAGQPIVNASIRVKDTAAETYSNAKGEFKFEIPMASEALLISAKGYKTKEIPVQRPLKAMSITLEQ
jgi:tetratricopeptide (TPR) repeat protein